MFSPQDRLEIFSSIFVIFISTSCVDKIFISTLWSYIYFTHFSHKNIYFQKDASPHPVFQWWPPKKQNFCLVDLIYTYISVFNVII